MTLSGAEVKVVYAQKSLGVGSVRCNFMFDFQVLFPC